MLVQATRLIRKMRGGAQAHLLECDDGHFYVVKFLNNPQHRRVLINEWIASVFLNYLQISTPEAAIVSLSAGFLEGNPEIYIQLGSHHQAVEPGWHFGSRYPGDPGKVMVYDFLPDVLLDKVVNAGEFLGALVFDKWMGNADARQSIFFRADEICAAMADSRRSGSLRRAASGLRCANGGPRLRIRRPALEVSRFAAAGPLLPADASIKKSGAGTTFSRGWIA